MHNLVIAGIVTALVLGISQVADAQQPQACGLSI